MLTYFSRFFDPLYLKKDKKRPEPKISFVIPVYHEKVFLKFIMYFQTFFARVSYGFHYSYFEKKNLKDGTGTTEDMLFTNIGVEF